MSSEHDYDAFCARLLAEISAALARAPKPGLRERILHAVASCSRFERFVPQVADMLALDRDTARAVLARLDDADAWSPGLTPAMRLLHVLGGPALSQHVAGFVQLPAGQVFPDHTHLGPEHTLVLHGSLRELDTGEILRAGEISIRPAGLHHAYEVRPGPDLLCLVTIREGVDIGDVQLRPPPT